MKLLHRVFYYNPLSVDLHYTLQQFIPEGTILISSTTAVTEVIWQEYKTVQST